jgi:putative ABC transport system substrate-binding protein
MKRRAFVTGLGAALVAPLGAGAQQAEKATRIGVLLFGSPDTDPNLPAFRDGLRELGYVEGRNIVLEFRFAESRAERLPALAAELVSLRPNAIFALGGDVAPSARAATATIPIVMAVSVDPVETQLVSSLARPGGNLTGVTFVASDLAAKRLELLKQIAPRITRLGVLWNPNHIDPEYRETQSASRSFGIQVQSLEVRAPADFDDAFAAASLAHIEAIMIVSSRLTLGARRQIADFTFRNRLVLVASWKLWAQNGAVLSYGPDVDAMVRRAAIYVDKILKGAKPSDLPVEQPTKFELVINLKTARALGLAMPSSLVARADHVIE